VTNASKYAYPDGPGAIEVSARKRDGRLEIQVSDHGVGLPEGFIIDQPRKSLGFRLIIGFVRQLGGRLLVEKNEPTGARFTVEMPILDGNADESGSFAS
jgi:two-component system, sensor histidine kinase PdtaS